ncbi:hypothetical protein B5807_00766 [Epicoccum nigrum]|uniref:Uncharacterized protein n=1 Tax=Epicoccum nigrum TaxID=105696 RepID=A0A1Y2MCS9_EPING|nr:hypothetical protein B5807_00766 [Epicoccum nigrum]
MRESQCQQKQSDGLSGVQLLRYDHVYVHSASTLSYRSLHEILLGLQGGSMAAWIRGQGWFWSQDTAAEDVRQQPYPGCDNWVNCCHADSSDQNARQSVTIGCVAWRGSSVSNPTARQRVRRRSGSLAGSDRERERAETEPRESQIKRTGRHGRTGRAPQTFVGRDFGPTTAQARLEGVKLLWPAGAAVCCQDRSSLRRPPGAVRHTSIQSKAAPAARRHQCRSRKFDNAASISEHDVNRPNIYTLATLLRQCPRVESNPLHAQNTAYILHLSPSHIGLQVQELNLAVIAMKAKNAIASCWERPSSTSRGPATPHPASQT